MGEVLENSGALPCICSRFLEVASAFVCLLLVEDDRLPKNLKKSLYLQVMIGTLETSPTSIFVLDNFAHHATRACLPGSALYVLH